MKKVLFGTLAVILLVTVFAFTGEKKKDDSRFAAMTIELSDGTMVKAHETISTYNDDGTGIIETIKGTYNVVIIAGNDEESYKIIDSATGMDLIEMGTLAVTCECQHCSTGFSPNTRNALTCFTCPDCGWKIARPNFPECDCGSCYIISIW